MNSILQYSSALEAFSAECDRQFVDSTIRSFFATEAEEAAPTEGAKDGEKKQNVIIRGFKKLIELVTGLINKIVEGVKKLKNTVVEKAKAFRAGAAARVGKIRAGIANRIDAAKIKRVTKQASDYADNVTKGADKAFKLLEDIERNPDEAKVRALSAHLAAEGERLSRYARILSSAMESAVSEDDGDAAMESSFFNDFDMAFAMEADEGGADGEAVAAEAENVTKKSMKALDWVHGKLAAAKAKLTKHSSEATSGKADPVKKNFIMKGFSAVMGFFGRIATSLIALPGMIWSFITGHIGKKKAGSADTKGADTDKGNAAEPKSEEGSESFIGWLENLELA